jgi:predicted MFS family arabinose efflux permease
MALLWLAGSPAVLAALLFCSGATLAPMLGRLYGQVAALAPLARSSEVFGWLSGALSAGGALGTVLGGELVAHLSARAAFPLAAVAAACAAGCALASAHKVSATAASGEATRNEKLSSR